MLNYGNRKFDISNTTRPVEGQQTVAVDQIGKVKTKALLGYDHSIDLAVLKSDAFDIDMIYRASCAIVKSQNLFPGTAIGRFFGNVSEEEATV